jgi:hypothetical protein
MTDKEIRGLSDEQIEDKLKDLAPKIEERDREGAITPGAILALRDSLPYQREKERRATIAYSAKMKKELAELDKKQSEEREHVQRMFRHYGNPLN